MNNSIIRFNDWIADTGIELNEKVSRYMIEKGLYEHIKKNRDENMAEED